MMVTGKKSFIWAISVALIGAMGCRNGKGDATASGQWEQNTSQGYTYRYVKNDPMKARFYTLKNGFTVMLSPNKREPRIRALVGVRAGSNNDPRKHTGLAHYLEHLLFKGTSVYGTIDAEKEKPYIDEIIRLYEEYGNTADKVKREEIYKKIDSVSQLAAKYAIANEYDKMMTNMGAIGTNAHTSFDETVYEETIPSGSLDKYLKVQAERFCDPVFRLFHTELETVYEEKNRSLDDDNSKLFDSLFSSLFPTHNYGQQTIIGTVDHLKNPSLVAIRDFYDKYYVPSNMGLALAGDFDPDSAIAKIDRTFGTWKVKDSVEHKIVPEADFAEIVKKEIVGPDAEGVAIAFRLPGALDNETKLEATMTQLLLANGKAGLMDVNLNIQQKVLTSGSYFMPMRDYSIFILEGKPQQGQSLDQVRDLVLAQLELLKKGTFDESVMEAIVSNYKLEQLKSLHNNDQRAVALMNAFIQNKSADWDKQVLFTSELGKLTRQKVVEFAKRSFAKNCAIIYKRTGEATSTEKVQKPSITPVPVNRDTQSSFATMIGSMPAFDVQPKWVNYEKDFNRGMVSGAEVLHVPNTDDQLFRLSYQIEAGSWNDKRIPLAVQYLDFLGDDKHSSESIKREFYQIGCDFSIKPGEEETLITISGLHENYSRAVSLFDNLLRNCQPDNAAWVNFKNGIKRFREDARLNKDQIKEGILSYALYGSKNPFNYQLSNQDLDQLKPDDMVQVLHGLLDFKHSIIYYGPQQFKEFVDSIASLHKLPNQFVVAAKPVVFKREQNAGKNVLFSPYNMVQAEVQWGLNSIPYDSSLIPTISLFNQYFGGSMGSLVFQTIRESRALAYSTYAIYQAPQRKMDNFVTVAYVGTQADKIKESILVMDDLLTDIPRSDNMFLAAKEAVRQKIANERIIEDGIVFDYLGARKLGLNSDIRRYVFENIENIQFENLKSFYDQHIARKKYSYCIIGAPSLYPKLSFLDPAKFEKLSLEQIFGY